MMTSVWPRLAIARADANGSIVSSTPLLTLDEATTRLVANSAAVATNTVVRPRDSNFLDPRAIEPLDASDPPIGVPGITIGGDSNADEVFTSSKLR